MLAPVAKCSKEKMYHEWNFSNYHEDAYINGYFVLVYVCNTNKLIQIQMWEILGKGSFVFFPNLHSYIISSLWFGAVNVDMHYHQQKKVTE